MMEKFLSKRFKRGGPVAVAMVFIASCKTAGFHADSSAELKLWRQQDLAASEGAIDPMKAVAVFSAGGTQGGGIARLDAWVPAAVGCEGAQSAISLEADALGRRLRFYPAGSPRAGVLGFSALVPIPFETPASEITVPVRILCVGRQPLHVEARLVVTTASYPSETLTVDPRHVTPDAQSLKRIRLEKKRLGAVYRASVGRRLWNGPFDHPVSSIPTSEFGIRRVFNGQMQSFHQGKDYRAPEGTPVLAAGAGRVAFAGDLYMTGNTVILDHGLGLFTIYAHLSALKVEEGKEVPKGTLLGLSGMTGRASGPHLHFGVNLSGLKVDPNDLLRVAR